MAEEANPYYKKVKNSRGYFKYQFTRKGLKKVEEMARIGCSLAEIASVVGVSSRVLQYKNVEQPGGRYDKAFARAFERGRTDYLIDLRLAQKELAQTNATMAIHLGKHELGQHDKPQEHHHTHRVVGTMPDYDATSEQWKRQFAPSHHPAITDQVEDAEVLEIEVYDDLIEKEDIPYGD